MRRSQAPSLRYAEKPQSDTKKDNDASKSIRGTDEVLSILLGGSCNQQPCKNDDGEEQTLREIQTNSHVVTNSTPVKENDDDDDVTRTATDPETLKIFNVVYGKQSKRKHKVWEGDGTIEVREKTVILKDEKGKIIGTTSTSKSKPIEEGSRLFIGSKEVEVIELLQTCSESTKEPSPVKQIIKKRKVNGKGFVVPSLYSVENIKSTLVLPQPNDQHQWQFNTNGLPLNEVYVERSLAKNLREHQSVGITFLYECVMGLKSSDISGAILADEMGLGKTLQTIALIWTLLKQGPYGNKPVVKKVLIVTPSSLTMNWHNEFIKWLGREKLVPYVIDSKNKPQDMRGPVMIVSYEMFVRYSEEIKGIKFDLLICDEGHRLKNSNIRTAQLLRGLECPKRILLTGTPIQNDLKEFYTLVDFVNPNILGTPAEFRRNFEGPILESRQPFADEEVLKRGEECAYNLNKLTSLFLLRRTKEVLEDYLPTKNEAVVFCTPTEIQREIYNCLINALIDNNEKLFGFSDGFFHLGMITSLKKVCNHPALLWTRDADETEEDILLSKINSSFHNVRGNYQPGISAKLTVVINFLSELKQNRPNERVVIVSNSTQTLDLLEKKISESGYSSCRLDGSVPTSQRASIVERFNRQYAPIFVFLLSSKAGGVGLNLTGASRLILYDSDWNPATDLQAMSRIWRDGQKTSVYIYRFLTVGTIEEKIYQRQISKQGLCEGIVDPQKSTSIKLSREELKELFSYCETQGDCSTHEMLSCKCDKNGGIPGAGVEEGRERACRLVKQSNAFKMNEILHWEHHGSPIRPSLLSELCLLNSKDVVGFIFRTCKR